MTKAPAKHTNNNRISATSEMDIALNQWYRAEDFILVKTKVNFCICMEHSHP